MLTILIGITGSGKTHWAENQKKEHPDDVVVIGRDNIRQEQKTRNEQDVTDIQYKMIKAALDQGKQVIVDNTNLKARYVQGFVNHFGGQTNIVMRYFPVDIATAIKQSKLKKATEKVVRGQAHLLNQMLKYPPYSALLDDPVYAYPKKIDLDMSLQPVILYTSKTFKSSQAIHSLVEEGDGNNMIILTDQPATKVIGFYELSKYPREVILREIAKRYYISALYEDNYESFKVATFLGIPEVHLLK
jgi:predicted kinase